MKELDSNFKRHALDVLEVVAEVIKELGSNFKRSSWSQKKLLVKQVDPVERLVSKWLA